MKKQGDIMRIDHVKRTLVYKDQFHMAYYPDKYPVTAEPHRHNFYQIMWFPKGEGIHCIDDVCFNMRGQDLFLLSEGQMHYFQEVKHLQGYMLMFKDVFWEEALQSVGTFRTVLFNHLLINVHLQLADNDAADISHLFDDMIKEYERPDYPDKADLMAAYLKILLIRISNLQRDTAQRLPHAGSNDYQLFRQFIELLEKQYASAHEVSYYASRLHITGRKLAEICRQYNSRSPKEMIAGRIIIAAKRELQFGARPIKEIAARLHFSDQYQFSKFFKKLAGISPVEYRG